MMGYFHYKYMLHVLQYKNEESRHNPDKKKKPGKIPVKF